MFYPGTLGRVNLLARDWQTTLPLLGRQISMQKAQQTRTGTWQWEALGEYS